MKKAIFIAALTLQSYFGLFAGSRTFRKFADAILMFTAPKKRSILSSRAKRRIAKRR